MILPKGLRAGPAELMIVAGSALFIFVLWLSAYLEPDIRWLHFFQAWMYIVAAWLSLRGNRWGYFIGFSAAGLWDYINLFVTTFLVSGLHWLAVSIGAGTLQRIDQLVAIPGWIGNFMVIVGAILGYCRLTDRQLLDAGRLILAFALSTTFFGTVIFFCQPRYVPLFRALLHSHWPSY